MSRQSVERAMNILSLFSISRPQLGITEISEALILTKPTVHGLVRTLLNSGFLRQEPETKKYSLGLSIYELGTVLAGTLKINQVGAGPALRLVQEVKKTARIALWDEDSVLVTLTHYPNLKSIQFCPPGPRVPAYCSSTGKAVLAWLPEPDLAAYLDRTPLLRYTTNTITSKEQLINDLKASRLRGYTVDCEEYSLGMACIGAPIFDATDFPIAGISLSGSPDQLLGEELSKMVKKLALAARDISIYMGFSEGIQATRAQLR